MGPSDTGEGLRWAFSTLDQNWAPALTRCPLSAASSGCACRAKGQAIAEQSAERRPTGFGTWDTMYRRFRDWARAGVFERMFNDLSDQPDMEMAMIDGTIVKVHRAGQGAKGGLSVRL